MSLAATDPVIANQEQLASYLERMIPEAGKLDAITKFSGGQSNPTYMLETGNGRLVLRKKPQGNLLKGAHQIEREFRVMSAMVDAQLPVPRLMHLCEDAALVGTSFYIMSFSSGRIERDSSMPESNPADRAATYRAMVETLARLHAVDWRAVGLAGFGKEENYLGRQVSTWTRQFQASQTHDIPAMDRLIEWLPAHLPPEQPATVVHGDFRLENLVLDPEKAEVVAILDWELATLGDPFADLAHSCTVYHLDREMRALGGLHGLDIAGLGIPSEQQYVSDYVAASGRALPEQWNFYVALGLFRISAILQGVYKRSLAQNASSKDASAVGGWAGRVADAALCVI